MVLNLAQCRPRWDCPCWPSLWAPLVRSAALVVPTGFRPGNPKLKPISIWANLNPNVSWFKLDLIHLFNLRCWTGRGWTWADLAYVKSATLVDCAGFRSVNAKLNPISNRANMNLNFSWLKPDLIHLLSDLRCDFLYLRWVTSHLLGFGWPG